MEPSLHWKSFLLHCKPFSENHSFLGGERTNVYWRELHFTWFFYIPMAIQTNSRSDWLNKNDHDYLLSRRAATEWDSIKNVFEITVHCKNAFVITDSVGEIADSSVGHCCAQVWGRTQGLCHSCVMWYSTLPTVSTGWKAEKEQEEGILSETMKAFVLHPYIIKSLTNGCELMTCS